MVKFISWLLLLGVLLFLLRSNFQRLKRRWRGEPEPKQQGPRLITRILIVIVIVYSVLLGYQLWVAY